MSTIQPKSTYEVLRPIGFMGSRFERGTTIELTDDQARSLSSDEIRPVQAAPISPVPDAEPVTTGNKVEAEVAVKPKGTRKAKK